MMIDNVLYLSTPYNRVVALDAETGARAVGVRSESLRGRASRRTAPGFVHRGVAAWRDARRQRCASSSTAAIT